MKQCHNSKKNIKIYKEVRSVLRNSIEDTKTSFLDFFGCTTCVTRRGSKECLAIKGLGTNVQKV